VSATDVAPIYGALDGQGLPLEFDHRRGARFGAARAGIPAGIHPLAARPA